MLDVLPNWTVLSSEYRLELIRPMIADGLSASQIAETFRNASRSAVCGFCARNNIKLPGLPTALPKQHGNKGAPNSHAIVAKAACKRAEPEGQVHDMEDGPGVDVTHLIGILDLSNQTCRWPVTGEGSSTLFCGDQVGAGSYCATHTKRSESRSVRL